MTQWQPYIRRREIAKIEIQAWAIKTSAVLIAVIAGVDAAAGIVAIVEHSVALGFGSFIGGAASLLAGCFNYRRAVANRRRMERWL